MDQKQPFVDICSCQTNTIALWDERLERDVCCVCYRPKRHVMIGGIEETKK